MLRRQVLRRRRDPITRKQRASRGSKPCGAAANPLVSRKRIAQPARDTPGSR